MLDTGAIDGEFDAVVSKLVRGNEREWMRARADVASGASASARCRESGARVEVGFGGETTTARRSAIAD
jgi:hypothetical protein